ncbi:MAG: SpoVA/SpoVAEb family sporulation membrane protein [Clostridia bacterium]|nr:SpoVA/SpoVAEb family sporulation membrane protein [Clostridia bacterium]MBQ2273624.1 SpoVA/SpoVAEb family sporulation membrane protein [Clostridia bacterium]
MRSEEYQQLVWKRTPKKPLWKGCLGAFLLGGSICLLGECFKQLYLYFGLEEKTSAALTSVSLIFCSILLTGIGVYDKLSRVGGAGTLVPITGFANATAAPVMEFRVEGMVLGIGPKIFSVAGSVIAYGVAASALYGVIYYILLQIGVVS